MLNTDAGSAMISLGKLLKEVYGYEKLVHMLCLAHAMHNVSDTIRKSYPKVDAIVMGIKSLFLFSHVNRKILKEKAPTIPQPPSPILTRWATWLKAVEYYSEDENRVGILRVLESILTKIIGTVYTDSEEEGE